MVLTTTRSFPGVMIWPQYSMVTLTSEFISKFIVTLALFGSLSLPQNVVNVLVAS